MRFGWLQVSGLSVTVFCTGDQYSFRLFLAWDRSVSSEAVLPDLQCMSDLGVELEYATEFLAAGNGCPAHVGIA